RRRPGCAPGWRSTRRASSASTNTSWATTASPSRRWSRCSPTISPSTTWSPRADPPPRRPHRYRENLVTKGLFDLTGKVALVTGGNSGLGLGFARGIAKQGGDIMIWSRNEERNIEAVEELRELGARAEFLPTD